MKFMHVADLHLDTPFVGMAKQLQVVQKQLIQAPFLAFERCVSIAINQNVDFMLIAGDVYDAERQTIYAQNFFLKQLKRLAEVEIPVVVGHGNHDFLNLEKAGLSYPENVYHFDQQEVTFFDLKHKNQEVTRIYGFSYTQRWIQERMIQHYPVNPQETDYTIGYLHGSVESLQSTKGNYAPFTVNELVAKNYDYWALGHIHQALVLNENPLIQYPGTIQGRHRNESGDKGAYIIELKQGQPPKSRFISLAPIVWQEVRLDCHKDWQVNHLLEHLEQVLNNYQEEADANQQSQLLTLILENAQRLNPELQEQIAQDQLSLVLPELNNHIPFVAIIKVQMQMETNFDAFSYDAGLKNSYLEALEALVDGSLYDEVTKDLAQHATMRTWLADLSKDADFKAEMIQATQQLMIQTLGIDAEEADHED
ncbi:metallophosphoesterase family protein [Vaginisenegalia massiliensis]|uniref:metallophosphoesterase family protein n=1 Tax=Vaginisenegalia massiliensis TaxID=2058294 RepID=UPI000F523650|nr:DNA repair exonuclease [Vaginisenegalia massiliensis]